MRLSSAATAENESRMPSSITTTSCTPLRSRRHVERSRVTSFISMSRASLLPRHHLTIDPPGVVLPAEQQEPVDHCEIDDT